MMATNHLGNTDHPRVRPVVASAALSTAISSLGLYRGPTVAEVTSRCDWRIADLINGKRPVSLHLVIPPVDRRTKPLVRLVLNQIGRRLTKRLDQPGNSPRRHQRHIMADITDSSIGPAIIEN